MPYIDRQNEILRLLEQEKRLSVKRLAEILYASEPTIRRDLNSLSKSGLLKKIHGGAEIVSAAPDKKIAQSKRINEQHDAKILMARKAAELIHDGDIIFLDASTSASYIIPFLTKFKDIIVITSGAKAVVELGERNIRCYSTGGQLLNDCFSFIGEEAKRTVAMFNADILFRHCTIVLSVSSSNGPS
ncbi:MAG TPA: DeoR/GlpR family DNA-binding transcription regulator [Armatimonadota bacterium]|nr:DeoR/GlpR family DNA-binding transcription regulator [Armatimonadota bacterium]